MNVALKTLLALACIAPLNVAMAQSDGFPARPTRLLVPWPPGGSVDPFARMLSQKLPEIMGQQVVVDYRPGASGNVGMELAARAAPDGYTVVLNSLPTVVNHSLFSKLAYDVTRDLAPVSLLADSPFVLVVHPSVPVSSVKELVALAKSKPGRLNYSSAGSGTNLHIAAELFKALSGANLTHIPYKGGGPALASLIGNEAQVSFLGIMVVHAQQSAGRMRALAVTSAKRSPVMPELPTIAEAGVPGYEFSAWYGVLIPSGAPRAVVSTWNAAIVKALRSPDMAERIAREGADVIASSPADFGAFLKTEIAKWAKVVKESGLKVE
ncbi:MAG: tripartite tricarboxylate transporter substrate binding protein [Burkholderiales bacterium]|nr:tripartite tricarboxylate transporter substrate binding protein [Burkholderiales bacterium]